jgi:hypothetical protein
MLAQCLKLKNKHMLKLKTQKLQKNLVKAKLYGGPDSQLWWLLDSSEEKGNISSSGSGFKKPNGLGILGFPLAPVGYGLLTINFAHSNLGVASYVGHSAEIKNNCTKLKV